MEAGRELDALVAERVMGQTDFEHAEIGETPAGDPQCWRCREIGAWGDSIFGDIKCIPHYSTNIAAAWQVVERLAVNHHWAVISRSGPQSDHWQVQVEFSPFGSMTIFREIADTAPAAICLAALKAIEK